jgi:hypothetical protein
VGSASTVTNMLTSHSYCTHVVWYSLLPGTCFSVYMSSCQLCCHRGTELSKGVLVPQLEALASHIIVTFLHNLHMHNPDHTCREEQDLRCGAVRTAVVTEGSGKSPSVGSLVYFHYTLRQESSRQVVASTLTEHGGSGCPYVAVLEKGIRIPRGWELVLKGKISSCSSHIAACMHLFARTLRFCLSLVPPAQDSTRNVMMLYDAHLWPQRFHVPGRSILFV